MFLSDVYIQSSVCVFPEILKKYFIFCEEKKQAGAMDEKDRKNPQDSLDFPAGVVMIKTEELIL